MIFIERNTTNPIVLSLNENVTIPNPFYIFSFQSLSTLDEYLPLIFFTTLNLSNYNDRYDLFELIEQDGGSTTGGNNVPLYLKPGQYTYKVYQSVTDSLNPVNFGSLLDTGKMVVGDMTEGGQDTGVTNIYQ